MPRDLGTGIYTYPDGTRGNPGQTIFSARYNTFLDDLKGALNQKLPLNMGGTGADTPATARTNIGAEVAMQTVTDYNSHAWETGSFKSDVGATNSPEGADGATSKYVGEVQVFDANNITIQVRNIAAGTATRVRKKSGGMWGAWFIDNTDQYVDITGDTMTGNLTAPAFNASNSNFSSSTTSAILSATGAGQVILRPNGAGSGAGQLIVDSGGNVIAASNFTAGAGFIAQNNVSMLSTTGAGQVILRPNGAGSGAGQFILDAVGNASAGNGRLWGASDGTPLWTTGGTINGSLTINSNPGNSSFSINANVAYWCSSITNNSTGASANGLMIQIKNDANWAFAVIDSSGMNWRHVMNGVGDYTNQGNIDCGQRIRAAVGYKCQAGASQPPKPNVFNIDHTVNQGLYIDNTFMGVFAYTSDYRTKENVEDLSVGWEKVKALRPVKYNRKPFTPPVELEKGEVVEPFLAGSDVEEWGFVAHELQETLTPSAATGVKDDPAVVQSPNPWVVIAALTKALQEAMARIEALEAKHG